MGGSLFKDLGSQRITSEEYEQKYVPALKGLLGPLGLRFDFVAYYLDKPDHGNINVIVNNTTVLPGAEVVSSATIALEPHRKKEVIEFLKDNGYVVRTNSNIVSFLFDNCLQIDLIFTNPACYDYSVAYFAWNDLGGLIGRLTRSLGLKHGSAGLYYTHYNEDKTKKLGEYLLSLDHDVTLEILGLDVERFKQGFQTLEEIFEFVVKSKYFAYKSFDLDELPCKDRHRDQKRNTFRAFDQYCVERSEVLPATCSILPEDKQAFVISLFPFVKKQIDEANAKEAMRQAVAQKFNGKIIMELIPELKADPRLLGEFIKSFKEMYPENILIELSPVNIEKLILSWFLKSTKEA